jgi:hypothetical protein
MKEQEDNELRCCKCCTHWQKMSVGEHTGYCEMMGVSFNYVSTDKGNRGTPLKVKTISMGVCDLHTFPQEQKKLLLEQLRRNPKSFEPRKKSIFNFKRKR